MTILPRRPFRLAALLPALLLGALLAPPAAADVLVVDAGGGAEFTSLPTAVQAAGDGDVVLVRPGDYTTGFSGGNLLILAKAISVVGDGTGPVITGPILVHSAPAGSTVLLRNLTVELPGQAEPVSGLAVNFCEGTVWAEGCTFPGKQGFFTIGAMPASPGVNISQSGDVVLVRCTATGGEGVDSFFPYAPTPGVGGAGVSVHNSGHVMIHDSTLEGGPGGDFVGFDGGPGPGGNGGDAVSAPDGNLLVSGCTLRGGDAGSGDEPLPNPTFYRGGDGVEATGAGAYVRVCDNQTTPGAGGSQLGGGTGPSGAVLNVLAGTKIQYSDKHRSFAVSSPTPENTDITLSYDGRQGDLLGVYLSVSNLSLPLLFNQGTWVLDAPVFGPYIIGTVSDPEGELELDFGVPDFGFGPDDAVVLFEQIFLQDVNGKLILSSPSTHVIVDGWP